MIKLNNLKEAHEYFKKLTGKQISKLISNPLKCLLWRNCCLQRTNIDYFLLCTEDETIFPSKYYPVIIFDNAKEFEDYHG